MIAWKLDRFARSVSEFLKLVTWSEEHGVALATADGALNTSTPGGCLVATILAALAQWEREMIQDRVTAAHAERREQGRWIAGRAPFPYVMERRDRKAYLTEDPKAFALGRAQILTSAWQGDVGVSRVRPVPAMKPSRVWGRY
ncbi:recombinase family protein [Streptomyces sp. NPDC098789]|uniref:recombinase family protein n=1 Tax=Streptomyces sp. NPDC098789 TaxID=3366098 RepID=UPI0037F5D133